jgi:SPP1 family predicted phage head-tail adaptor
MMRAGRLNKRITIQQLAAGQDEIGQPVQTWTTVATVWADICHQSGLEAIKGDAVTSLIKASIRIRYRNDLNAGMRAVYGATAYNILAVLPDVSGKEYVDLACEVVS